MRGVDKFGGGWRADEEVELKMHIEDRASKQPQAGHALPSLCICTGKPPKEAGQFMDQNPKMPGTESKWCVRGGEGLPTEARLKPCVRSRGRLDFLGMTTAISPIAHDGFYKVTVTPFLLGDGIYVPSLWTGQARDSLVTTEHRGRWHCVISEAGTLAKPKPPFKQWECPKTMMLWGNPDGRTHGMTPRMTLRMGMGMGVENWERQRRKDTEI